MGKSPYGPFTYKGVILQPVLGWTNHHSIAEVDGKWYIFYHRRPLGITDRNHRVVCIDELRFESDGKIAPVTITHAGVAADPIR